MIRISRVFLSWSQTMTTEDAVSLHHDLVRDWLNYGPDEVHAAVLELSHEELVQLVMLHTGKSAMLSSK